MSWRAPVPAAGWGGLRSSLRRGRGCHNDFFDHPFNFDFDDPFNRHFLHDNLFNGHFPDDLDKSAVGSHRGLVLASQAGRQCERGGEEK